MVKKVYTFFPPSVIGFKNGADNNLNVYIYVKLYRIFTKGYLI